MAIGKTVKKKRLDRQKFTDQIREVMRNSGVSLYRISKETGIPNPSLYRFMNGKRGLSLDSLDVIADFLNFNIATDKNDGNLKGK